ncbi:aminotransferase class III-fold pyridoxal phosphate-dependent enzyme [Nocardioides sp. HM23]|uniref:aminotransferase class III-fold pyridoxal phosphate-dependent enzyme n=1 Tax=Nocardioides bizhenqiangii TaxID=3095076 RepID=UPI002ACA3D47|nr:aminotransferase class III-fold pyridoxal phosphate-dependent enzyme [Nocardioides sp. HM23]MDZ5619725.1 aminotransferase class III-fold pyridoxal phosphate-dependent enzyme [Nocardioides sp. HM23]
MSAIPDDPLSVPSPDLDVDALRASVEKHWGLAGDLTPLHGERDRNFRLDSGPERHLLKVHNPADRESVLDLQCSALRHLRSVAPELPVPGVVPTRDGRPWVELTGRDGRRSLAWVLTWLEGRHPEPDAVPLREWGRTSARLGRALRGFAHPAATHPILWDIQRLPELRSWLAAVPADRRPAIEVVLDRFERRVVPALPRLRAQVVHNDFAPTNVLVDDSMVVTGITDFGDMTHTALVCDLAVAAADLLSERADGLDLAGEVVAGYGEVTPLEPEELALVADLIAGRYAATVLITAWRTREQGWAPPIDDEAYLRLEAMLATGLDVLATRFETPSRAGRSTEDLAAARARAFGGQELSYDRPLHLVSGKGVELRAADGRRYLDAYNNVPVLGHSHPAVVAAARAQLATLNTNSRYLQDAPVELAERLLGTVPERFDRVLLVNSGSEANDLAWRIARHATGSSGGVATEWAYHGVTEATYAFSPESWRDAGPPAHIRVVPPPPTDPAAVVDAVRSLAGSGHGVAAMLVDGVFTSDGVLGPAHEWTRAAAAAVHDAGGLYVADEVQAGHGRTGLHLWSFAAGDVPADLVTLGKPMGNGYPVAAVIGPAALVDPFVRGTDYFSTFGGGTAACAVALAVLRTIDDENLVDRAAVVGSHLLGVLREVANDHPDLSAVRGWGLALAVDVVDPATGRPDADRAGRIVEGMRDRGVLIGRTGRDRATLKIRPPLVFDDDDVDQLATALAATCAELH